MFLDLKKKPYIIEVWEDRWVPYTEDLPAVVKERGGYWTEVKSVRIGDSDSDFLGKAFNPILTRNVSGEIHFEFSIYGYYYENDKRVSNFLVPFLFNEVKIKLKYDDEWYDFIIKNMEESHDKNGLIYTVSCEYLPMSELSKNGWGISFSLDQENCIGTIKDFTDVILDGTDWTYIPDDSCNLTEYSLEYLYAVKVKKGFSANTLQTFDKPTSKVVNFVVGDAVYVPYTQLEKTDNMQVIYNPSSDGYALESDYIYDKGANNFSLRTAQITCLDIQDGENRPKSFSLTHYYGYRVVQTADTIWEPELQVYATKNRVVNVEDGSVTYFFGFPATEIEIDKTTLEATPKTVTRYYKYTNGEEKGDIYKVKILYGVGAPTEEANATLVKDAVYRQKYIDTATSNYQVYRLEDSGWVEYNTIDGKKLKPGEDEVYYYYDEDFKINPHGTYRIGKLQPVYLEKNEKQRSLVEEKSNRFNLIQSLAEIFEVWSHFYILHDEDGRIKLDKQTYLPCKYLTFKTEFGKDNFAGFSFDINLSSISRTVNTDALATKMYVEVVDNENSTDGICSIQTADNNISKELFLINLDYFTQVGMIDRNKLLKDLYGTTSDDLGYLYNLGKLNTTYTEASVKKDDKDGIAIQVSTSQELVKFYNDSYDAARQELKELLEKEKNGLTYSESQNIEELKKRAQDAVAEAKKNLENEQEKLRKLNIQLDNINQVLDNVTKEKEKLNQTFYNIYSRFLQEGTWQGDDYIDPNAYYLDAQKVCLESSRPAVEYTIDVLDICQAIDYVNGDNYEQYNYQLGDITYVEDPDYFGRDNTGRPYREKVIVSEIESDLDSPKDNKITVKNYKTRFEDLFQRTTATVQSYNLNKNVYERASIIDATNSISHDTLQNTLANNSFILSQSKTNSVIIDDSGIEVSNLNDFSEKVRIVAGGIFISNDGGNTWNSGITGAGINTKYLTAGQIDVEKINLMNGSYPTFAWDKYGINAFSWHEDTGSGLSYGYSSSFIRFDQYGIYGVRNSRFNNTVPFLPNHSYSETETGIKDDSINDIGEETTVIKGFDNIINNIRKYAQFSLTWNGFNLKTNNGSVEIDSANDIRVLDRNNVARVKLGQIGINSEGAPSYGLMLQDNTGTPTLKSTDEGNLALTGIMYIGDDTNSLSNAVVAIGKLGTENIIQNEDYKGKERRILIQKETNGNPDPTFVVYSDGSLYLQAGITAEFGKIGGFTIEDNRLYSNDVVLSPNGISITRDVTVGEGDEAQTVKQMVFNADSVGNLHFNNGYANNLTVNGGKFENISVDANGSFSGSIEAVRGYISGSMILGPKQYGFTSTLITNAANYTDELTALGISTESCIYIEASTENSKVEAIAVNDIYFTQSIISGQNEILVYKVVKIVSSTEKEIKLVCQLVFSKYLVGLTEEQLTDLNKNTNIFYKFNDQNIVLDGRSGDIYTFNYYLGDTKGYSFNGNGNIYARTLTLGSDSSFVNINNNSININVMNKDGEASGLFSVDDTGTLTTNRLVVKGDKNNFIAGAVIVGNEGNNITINGTKGSIFNSTYAKSSGADGWNINREGSAIFNDVTIRGRIESSTFVEKETQALAGELVIRPTLTFIDDTKITKEVQEDGSTLYVGFINENVGSATGIYQIKAGTNYYSFKIERQLPQDNGTKIWMRQLKSTEVISDEVCEQFITMPMINIGSNNESAIGISLNANNNEQNNDGEPIFGFPGTITIYEQLSTIDEESNDFSTIKNNRLIMGRLPNKSFIPASMQNSYGLYAENVYLKGSMISADRYMSEGVEYYLTSGINTSEQNGNIFWAGALGDTTEDIAAAPFRVTKDGYIYAKKGLFEGEINAAVIRTGELIGREQNGYLKIKDSNNTNSYITFEKYIETVVENGQEKEKYAERARLGADGFLVKTPLSIYNEDSPILLTIEKQNAIGVNNFISFDCYEKDSKYKTSGWGMTDKVLYYKEIDNNLEFASNYVERVSELLQDKTENLFEIKLSEAVDKFVMSFNGQNLLTGDMNDGVSVYNNLFLNDAHEIEGETNTSATQCSFKVVKENNDIIGYNLYIEEI